MSPGVILRGPSPGGPRARRVVVSVETPMTPLRLLPAAALLAACADSPDPPEPPLPQEDPTPDIVLFLIDTLRADRCGPYGANEELTPTMNRLAEHGVVFEQAHSPGPWTLPSVVSIFTGRHIAEHNVVQEEFKLSESIPIIPQLLVDRGYTTASFHKNPFAGRAYGLDAGFDYYEHVRRRSIHGKTISRVFDMAGDSPYFLYVHNVEPHDPHVHFRPHHRRIDPVDPEFLERYGPLVKRYRGLTRADFVQGRQLGTTDNTEQQREALEELASMVDHVENVYAGSVSVADARIASVIEAIQANGRWDDTLFILLSDHGEELADHGGWLHDQSVYQELLRVPLIIRFPGDEYAGRRISTPVSLVDVMPTILEVAGADAEGVRMSGRSLMPLVRGEEGAGNRPRVVGMRDNERKYYRPWAEERGDVNIAVRQGDWKAIYNLELDTVELYDLAEDPGEEVDVSEEHSDLAEELRRFAARRYAELVRDSEQARAGGIAEGDAELLEALEELGYVGGEDE